MQRLRGHYRNRRVGPFNELLYWPPPKPIPVSVTVNFILLETGDKLLLEDGSSTLQE